jgi:hypothetical protein
MSLPLDGGGEVGVTVYPGKLLTNVFYSASAPDTISISSLVIDACRARL